MLFRSPATLFPSHDRSMSEAELIFTALAEMSTRQIAESMKAKGMKENKVAGQQGGQISKTARVALENKTKQKIVPPENYLSQLPRKK